MIGRRVAQYEIHESLGAGGMGVVFKAWDTRLDRFVALKFLPPAFGSQESLRRRFVREAKAASAVEHPNVCAIHEIGETEDGQLFICMAYCEGRSLKDELGAGPIGVDRALRIARELLSGLERAHAAGVVHRDLKPANVMLLPDGRVKLVDFGLAQMAHKEGLTEAGMTMGTVAYMSPEQIRGGEVGPATDLWSLGVILSEMLTGRHPFEGSTPPAVCRAILDDSPAPLFSVAGERSPGEPVPPAAAATVARLLAKLPGERFGSATEVLAALSGGADWQSGETISMPVGGATSSNEPPAREPRGPRRLRKRYVFALLSALLASVLTAYLVRRDAGGSEREFRLAVLPFENFTGDESLSYLSDGLAAGLITSLSELHGLQVLSRGEAWSHRDGGLGSVELAHRLGVATLLEGSLRRDGEDLVVDVELLDGEGTVLFSRQYRGGDDAAMELGKRISRGLTEILEIPLNREERSRLAEVPTRSFQAFDLYLRGQQELDRGRSTTSGSSLSDADAGEAAVALFREAIRLDPEFALAWASLSEAYWLIAQRDRNPESLKEARAVAERALEIDSDLPAAIVSMARLERRQGERSEALAALRVALDRHPHPDEAQRELGLSYEAANDLKAAEDAFRGATLVGGEDWYNWNALGAFFWRLGRYDEAQTAFERAAAVAPAGIIRPRENLATLEISRGRFDAAIDAFAAIEGPVRSAILTSNIGTAYYFSDRPDHLKKAGEYFGMAVRLNPRDDEVQRNLADLLLLQGRREEAMERYRTARELVESGLEANPDDQELRLRRAFYAARAADCDLAGRVIRTLEPELAETARNAHRKAYVFALCGQAGEALEALTSALDLGASAALIRSEDEFASLRGLPEFQALVGDPAGG